MNRHQRRAKMKSQQAHHRLIAATAFDFAAAYYEDLMTVLGTKVNPPRYNFTWNGEDYYLTEYQMTKLMFPNAEAYASKKWDDDFFIDEAKKTLGSMCGMPNVSEHEKEQIAEALMLEQIIPGQGNKKPKKPVVLH